MAALYWGTSEKQHQWPEQTHRAVKMWFSWHQGGHFPDSEPRPTTVFLNCRNRKFLFNTLLTRVADGPTFSSDADAKMHCFRFHRHRIKQAAGRLLVVRVWRRVTRRPGWWLLSGELGRKTHLNAVVSSLFNNRSRIPTPVYFYSLLRVLQWTHTCVMYNLFVETKATEKKKPFVSKSG